MLRLRVILLILLPFLLSGQETAIDSLSQYHEATALNSGKIQQEMIYLHLDNTSYYRGDRVFFAGYLVTSGKLKPSKLSQTVYVELLNPSGKIIDRCVLKSVDGRFHGSLLVDETPFYSGYYEIRAYTKYMLNFGQQAMYSRVIPVFAEPKTEGDWADRRMLKYGSSKHPFNRPKPANIIPEPQNNQKDIIILVEAETDTVAIAVKSDKYDVLGATLSCRGELCGRAILDFGTDSLALLKASRHQLPTGVIQLTLFNADGVPVAEKLFFNNKHDLVEMEYYFDKAQYAPYEPIELTVKLSQPIPFSLSVTDAAEHVGYNSDIHSELLLAQELRGFVPDLADYIDNPDSLLNVRGRNRFKWSNLAGMEPWDIVQLPEQGIEVHGSVQGAMRNTGKDGVTVSVMLNSLDNDTTTYIDEFITDSLGSFAFRCDLSGDWMMTLSSTQKGKRKRHRILLDRSERPPVRGYDIAEMQYEMAGSTVILTDSVDSDESLLNELERKGVRRLKEVEVKAVGGHAADVRQYIENAVASYDVAEARNLLQDQGKKHIRRLRDIMPLIDPKFNFNRDSLLYGTKQPLYVIDEDLATNDKVLQYSDIDSSNPADISVDMVKNVYINTQPQAINEYAIRYFESGIDLKDDFVPPSLVEWADRDASSKRAREGRDFKSSFYQSLASRLFGCVIFVELNTNGAGFIRPGMRRNLLVGYMDCEEYKHPDYANEPPVDPDFRRTLYWNPNVIPDENGVAHIKFYNNGTATTFNVTATTITDTGKLGSIR